MTFSESQGGTPRWPTPRVSRWTPPGPLNHCFYRFRGPKMRVPRNVLICFRNFMKITKNRHFQKIRKSDKNDIFDKLAIQTGPDFRVSVRSLSGQYPGLSARTPWEWDRCHCAHCAKSMFLSTPQKWWFLMILTLCHGGVPWPWPWQATWLIWLEPHSLPCQDQVRARSKMVKIDIFMSISCPF